MGERRSDTRERIHSVALELFAEQGYDKTSLREIAERLGVTKAALYYHFKTKEDIIASLFSEVGAQLDEILALAEHMTADGRTMTTEGKREIIRRYAEIPRGPGGELMKFMAENGPVVRELKATTGTRDRISRLARLLSDDETSVSGKMRVRMSLFCFPLSFLVLRDLDIPDEERHAAAVELALGLVASGTRVTPGTPVTPRDEK